MKARAARREASEVISRPASVTITLNADMGGIDFTGALVPQRSQASPRALRAVYADDLFNSGSLGLRTTPVIDQRDDLDAAGLGNDIHTTDWSFVMRSRLLAANGTDGNQVIIENAPTAAGVAAANAYELAAMDAWLTAIGNDHSGRSAQQKVLRDRPASLGDGCFLSPTDLVHQTLTDPSSGQCGAAFPVAANPRLVAGEGLSMTALKCDLRPLRFSAIRSPSRPTRSSSSGRRSLMGSATTAGPAPDSGGRSRAGSVTAARPTARRPRPRCRHHQVPDNREGRPARADTGNWYWPRVSPG